MKFHVSAQVKITDWITVSKTMCACGHGHQSPHCVDEACDCNGYREAGVDLAFSPSVQTWGIRSGSGVTALAKDCGNRTSRQLRVNAIRAAATN